MNEFYTHINKRLYYITVIIVIFLLITGILVKNPFLREVNAGYIIQIVLAFILTICLLLYPKYVTHYLRVIITITGAAYFYVLFFLYPETWSTFIFLCLIPASAIMFFDSKLFYFSIALNSITIILLFGYIAFVDKGNLYPYIKQDIIGNVINFIGSQGILSFIFYLSHGRIKKQQLYYEQIQQSERLKTTGQLAAAVAHEIRNPLTVVKGFLQLYKDDPEVNNDKKGHFTLMIDELNTAEQVISQFLAVAKPTKELETETVNVKSVLQSVTDLLLSYGLLHDKKIELEMIEDCYIAANNIEMKQLLINIIKNAIEASKEGDSVYIVAGRKKDAVEIKVIDYGTGMTEEEVNSLGTPFYSLKSKGTGLGMMICFNIAAKYKGTIRFQSAKGKGTTVTISFPAIK
ncbi:sensor histidine kinase [Metabacillus niabensis]|uniref:histidine kinase n=1 Tax=Metabacillus niabensis TaxID=324854 RepID=A0ABT9Z9G5_9BACI|nr:HAMP domain-containing sensor histidine kinase [Metabacillus niabensis]MDQ0228471.1 two-component system sporulation sensor kinase B [Metabacillus niabensis]